jgi:parallel beta-helix repeat protein
VKLCSFLRPILGLQCAFAATALCVGIWGTAAAGAPAVSGDLAGDTIWEGAVEVSGAVKVPEGATLLIQPGTVVRFSATKDAEGKPQSGLTVEGILVAQGTADRPIVFTSAAEKPEPLDWNGILLETNDGRASRIAHASIRYALAGIRGAKASLFAEDVEIRDCLQGIAGHRELRGSLVRGKLTGNEYGAYFFQSSGFKIEDSRISGNTAGGVLCTSNSSPGILHCTIADNGPEGVACIQGSSPLIQGNTISGHKVGIFMELQSRPRILRNLIRENDTGIAGEKLVFPVIEGNTITRNGTGIYCNYSAYPQIHGNNIDENRTFAVVLGDNMSILMEKKIPFRQMGQAFFGTPPAAADLPEQNRKFQPFAGSDEGIVDARGNWWGQAPTAEMAKLPPDGNSAVIEDFYDKPDTWWEGETFRRDRVVFAPWEPQRLQDTAPPDKAPTGVRGKIAAAGKPVAGVRVHAYADAATGFLGEGITYSAPSAADGSYALDLPGGSWYLVAKGPLPPFPNATLAEGALFGYYGGNPVALGVGTLAMANVQVVQRRPQKITQDAPAGASLVEGIVVGPNGPVPGATIHVYTDASRQFRGPDLFGPQGAVVGGTDQKGAFSVELPAGSYFLVASKRKAGDVLGPLQPGDLHGWYDGNPVVVAAGTRTSVVVQVVAKVRDAAQPVTPPASAPAVTGIRGTLRDAGGKVPKGAYAFATTDPSFMIGAMPPFRSHPVGADGAFFIEIPTGGTYYVSARSGYGGPPLPGEWHGFHGEGKPAPVVVEANKITEGIAIVLKRME